MRSQNFGQNWEGEYNPINGEDLQINYLRQSSGSETNGYAGKPLRSGHTSHVNNFLSNRFMHPPSSRRRNLGSLHAATQIVPDSPKESAAESSKKTNLSQNYKHMQREQGGVVPHNLYEVPMKPLVTPKNNLPVNGTIEKQRRYGTLHGTSLTQSDEQFS